MPAAKKGIPALVSREYGILQKLNERFLKIFKMYRRLELQEWDCALESGAQQWTDTCTRDHSDLYAPYGENYAGWASSGPIDFEGMRIV